MKRIHDLRKVFKILSVLSLLAGTLLAQRDRIAGEIDPRRTLTLKGNVSPSAQAQFDEGPVNPSTKLNYVTLTVKTSASQQAELDRLLVDLQDPLSQNYHKWLTPEEYADRFGASPADMAKIVTWMQSQGFEIISVARGRKWIAFNSTAQQIQNALHTEIRHYRVDGELHFANATEPSVPEAIDPMVLGFQGLDDFGPKSRGHATNSSGGHNMAPGDIATIYDITPVYNAGITGAGIKIAIVGQSDFALADIRQFRSRFGLPANDPQVVLVPGATDPGMSSAQGEATLDVEWSGAVAPNAQIIFVNSTAYYSSFIYALDQNLAPVISVSVGWCEDAAGQLNANIQAAAQQANAQGATVLVASGDWGAAGCDMNFNVPATHAAGVNGFASPPEVTGVGGTMFAEGNGNYWLPFSGKPDQASARGYIPEVPWNESFSGGVHAATGGGYSKLYFKPAWQSGNITGTRGVPDVAFTSASHDSYLLQLNGKGSAVDGTSVATPVFAGIVALLNQYLGSSGLGNINPNLYRLAQSTTGVFHDITTGNNFSPCVANSSQDCMNGRTAYGFLAGPGWDPVTGLGSIDAYNLATQWKNGLVGTTTSVTASPSSFTLGDQTKLTVTVTAAGSSVTPTGTVAFALGNNSLGTATLSGSGSSATATLTVSGSQLPAGSDAIKANYGGDSHMNGSTGSVTVTVSVPITTSAVIPSISPNPVFEQQPNADGDSWFYAIRLTEVAGASTTLTGFTIDGQDYSSSIVDFFGTSSIPANGTLATSLETMGLTVPTIRAFSFSGKDASGRTWTQQLYVPFYGLQIAASMSLASVPGTVRQNPGAAANCQWFQNLSLQEESGHTVYLTRFLAGGYDLSDRIPTFFPSTTLPALGSMIGAVCWSGIDIPSTLSYEIDGVDDGGFAVFATLSVPFTGPAASPGKFSVSPGSVSLTIADSSKTVTASVSPSLPSGQQWTVSLIPSNQTTNWLVVYPLSGTGPAKVTISASGLAGGLDDGVYQATLAFQSVDTLPQVVNVPITFVVGHPAISGIVNGASFVDKGLSPGLIFTLTGTGFGPLTGQGLQLDSNGRVATTVAGVKVLVDGTPAPLLYVQAGQINAVAPYEIVGKVGQRVNVQVMNNGVAGGVSSDLVAGTAPAIFSLGNGQGAILNQDGSVNGPGNPAARGSYIAIYGTGEGQTSPPGIDGRIANDSVANLPRPVAPFSISIGGQPATYIYAGAAPQSFAGFFQANAMVPANVAPGNAPVVLTIGGVSSPPLNVVVQ